MSAQSHAITRKGLALVTAGMFAFSSMSIAPVATAQIVSVEVDANQVSQLKNISEATLTVHKRSSNTETVQGTNQYGTDLGTEAPGKPLAGAVFTVYKVKDIDLTTIEGWKKYEALGGKTPQQLKDAGQLEEAGTIGATGTDGTASKSFPVGVYAVFETTVPAGHAASVPFITALPFTTQDGKGWNTNVHVYPKNQELTNKKEVKDQGKQASQDVNYTLSGALPQVPSGQKIDNFELIDIYDNSKWTPDDSPVVSLKATGGEGELTFETGDYSVSTPAAHTGAKGNTQFTISLTESGRTKLQAYAGQKAGIQVVAEVKGKLADGLVSGDLINELQTVPPNFSEPGTKLTPTPPVEVESKYGKINVTKVDSANAETKLGGAEFELHKCENSNQAGNEGTLIEGSQPISVGGNNRWETADDGTFSITGIQLEDWFDGKEQPDSFDYCLVETKAPKGYERLPKPILVPVNQKTPSADASPFTLNSQISNVKTTTETFRLPTTGEWGRWWLVGLGVLAILAAAGVLIANNRRNSA